MTPKLFSFLLIAYLLCGAISFLLLRKSWRGRLVWGVLMSGILLWQIVQYNMTFGLTSGPLKDVNARFGLIGAMIWSAGGLILFSVFWRLIFPKAGPRNNSKSNRKL